MGSRIRVWRIALATLGSVLVFGLHATASDVEVSSPVTPEGSTSSREINGTSSSPNNSTTEPQKEKNTTLPERLQNEPPVPVRKNPSSVYEDYIIYEKNCRIRRYDYKDPAVVQKYFTEEPTKCPKDAEPFMFYPVVNSTAGRSCVGIDEGVLKKWYGGNISKWECTYRGVARGDPSFDTEPVDMSITLGEMKVLNVGDCPDEEYIWIECSNATENILSRVLSYLRFSQALYEQPLMLPMVKETHPPTRPTVTQKKPLHVLVLGIDSLSRLNAHRQLPRTLEFLQSKKHLIELFGYNKIGRNSFPNQMALLTGIPHEYDELEEHLESHYFDNLTRYLWDHYEERGFRTMYYENSYEWGLFLYPASIGFRKVPTTYWPLPIIEAIEDSPLKTENGDLCIGPDLPAKHYLDYTANLMEVLGNDRPLFSYQFLVEATHNDLNGGRRLDKYTHDMFTKMEIDGTLNNTAVFFISDHGFRFGGFRKTELGKHEDMLPFGFVLMPDWYYEANPGALQNIRTNSRRLVTVFDLHATLRELADPWSEGRITRTERGYSLLGNEIPHNRSCEDAGINFQYCNCFESHPQPKDGNLSQSLAAFAIGEVNGIIKNNSATSKCEQWSVVGVEDLVRFTEGDKWTDFYKATIVTKPGALFEVAAKYHPVDGSWELLSEVERTDWYSSHSVCVKNRSFESYCYCKRTYYEEFVGFFKTTFTGRI